MFIYIQVNALKDVVEDMLTRLEEFQTFMEMVGVAHCVLTLVSNSRKFDFYIEIFYFRYVP